jgi:hypothetical protein
MARKAKTELAEECRKVIRGLRNELPNVNALTLDGEHYALQAIVDLFQAVIDAGDQTARARSAWLAAAGREEVAKKRLKPVRNALKRCLESTYGLAFARKLGFVSTEPAKPKPKTQVKAAQQREATRKARGTMGTRQRKKIKGKVEG